MAISMADSAAFLSNPIVVFALRAALGAYVVFMSRSFYTDPFAYFRKWLPGFPEYPRIAQGIRATAVFCIWGTCFILATAIATQIWSFHGLPLALALILLAAIATYFLLPASRANLSKDETGDTNLRQMK